jgi:hypothetical protein
LVEKGFYILSITSKQASKGPAEKRQMIYEAVWSIVGPSANVASVVNVFEML